MTDHTTDLRTRDILPPSRSSSAWLPVVIQTTDCERYITLLEKLLQTQVYKSSIHIKKMNPSHPPNKFKSRNVLLICIFHVTKSTGITFFI